MYTKFTGNTLKAPPAIDFISDNGKQFSRKPAFGGGNPSKVTSRDVYDLVIIPAMRYDKITDVLQRERRLIGWIKAQHQRRASLASICVGAFMLAETGLLNGKVATTNWMFADAFRAQFPEVEMQDDKIIIDQDRLYSCGGAFSFTTFVMYLIEKFWGREAALVTSKILMINLHEQPQSAFSIFRLQHDHADDVIGKIQAQIEKNFQRPLSVEAMAGDANMSLRNFIRRFEKATGNTPLEYLQRVRVEAAKKMLEKGKLGIEQVARQCGYEDMNFFRKIFRRHVAMTPQEYQQKYGTHRLKAIVAYS